jgi:hypothetical protein
MAKMRCDPSCLKRYQEPRTGRFRKTKRRGRFKTCTVAYERCCDRVESPERLCAYLGRRRGRVW